MKIIKFKHLLIGALLAVLITSFTFAAQQDNEISNDSARKKIVQALSKELKRSQKELHMEGFESPYFILLPASRGRNGWAIWNVWWHSDATRAT